MRTIEYTATYGGILVRGIGLSDSTVGDPTEETIRVQARDINAGFAKALKRAHEPLGNGNRRMLVKIEFSQAD
jgi:hypothetical protein